MAYANELNSSCAVKLTPGVEEATANSGYLIEHRTLRFLRRGRFCTLNHFIDART